MKNPEFCTGEWAKKLLANPGSNWQNEFTPAQYYNHLRKEIEREDGITNQRLTWAMNAQGFLIAALTILLVSPWPSALVPQLPGEIRLLRVVIFREFALLVVPAIGLVSAYITYRGVSASRQALEHVKNDWKAINDLLCIVPEMAPHAFGDGPRFVYGSRFAIFLPGVFALLWLAYIAVYGMVLMPLVLAHIRYL